MQSPSPMFSQVLTQGPPPQGTMPPPQQYSQAPPPQGKHLFYI